MALRAADVSVPVTPDVRAFGRDLARQIATQVRGLDVDVPVEPTGLPGFKEEVKKTAEEAAREARQAMSRAMKDAGRSMQQAGRRATMGLTLPIVAAGGAALKVAGDFERSMNMVGAVTGAAGDELVALEDQAKELGRTTQYSASEAGEAMYFLASAGFDTNEVLGAMPGTLQLAAAAQMELGEAADITSNILSGYGMDVEDLGRVNDVLVRTFQSTNVNVGMLGESFSYAAPILSDLGIQFEEASAAMGLLGNAGIQGTRAGTALSGAMTRLLNPSDKAAQLMEDLGVNVLDAQGDMLPLGDVLSQLEGAFGGVADSVLDSSGAMMDEEAAVAALSGTGERGAALMQIFGQRAGPAMAALLAQGSDELGALTGELEDAGGTAERVAAVQMEGLVGAMREFRSAMEGVAIAIAESGIMETVTGWAQSFSGLMQRLAEANPMMIRIGVIVAAVAAAFGPLLWIAGTMTVALGALLAPASAAGVAFSVLGGTVAGVIGTVFLAVAAVAAIVAAFVIAYKKVDWFREAVDRVVAFVRDAFVAGFAIARDAITTLIDVITRVADRVGTAFAPIVEKVTELGGKLVEAFVAIGRFLLPIVAGIAAVIVAPIVGVVALLIGVWRRFGDQIVAFLGRTIDRIAGVIGGIIDVITGIVDVIVGIFTLDPGRIAEGFGGAFGGIIDIIANVFGQVLDTIGTYLGAVAAAFDTIGDAVWGVIGGPVTAAIDWLVGAWDAVVGAARAVGRVIGAVFSAIGDAATWLWRNMLSPVVDNIVRGIGVVVGIARFMANVWELAFRLVALGVSNAWGIIQPILSTVADWIGNYLLRTLRNFRRLAVTVWDIVSGKIEEAWGVISPVVEFLAHWIGVILVRNFRFWSGVATGVWDAVSSAIRTVWRRVIEPTWDAIQTAIDRMGERFGRFRDGVVRVWESVRDGIGDAWDWIRDNVFDRMERWVTETLPRAFGRAKDAIGRAWSGFKDVIAAPFRWVADNVWNPFADTLNTLAGKVGMAAFAPRIVLGGGGGGVARGGGVREFHRGGLVGRDGDDRDLLRSPLASDEQAAVLQRGEMVLTPEQQRALTSSLTRPHEGVFRNDRGEEIGGPLSWAKGVMEKSGDWLADRARDVLGFAARMVDPALDMVRDQIARMGARFGNVGALAGGALTLPIDRLGDWLSDKLQPFREESALGTGVGWQKMWDVVSRKFGGAVNLHSGYRPGAVTATGNQSYHSMGRAIDITPSMSIANWLRDHFMAQTKELIYSPMGGRQVRNGRDHTYSGITRAMHWDHIHWAMDKGGVFDRPTTGVFTMGETAASRPEVVSPVPVMADTFRRVLAEPRASEGGHRIEQNFYTDVDPMHVAQELAWEMP